MARKPSRKAPPGCYWREGTLWARVKIGGEDIRWSLHTSDPTVALKLREQKKKELSDQVHHGIEPKRTIDHVMSEWAPLTKRNKQPQTAKRYACSLDQLEPYIGGKTLDQINGKLIAAIIDGRMADGVTNATIKRDLVALSSVMNYAIRRGYIESNPVLPRMKLVEERRDPIILPQHTHIKLVRDRCPAGLAKMVDAALATGCRQDELVKATWDRVDHRRREITVIGKRNKLRVIDLTPFDGYQVFADQPGVGAVPIFAHYGCHGDSDVALRYHSASQRFGEVVEKTVTWAKREGLDFCPFTFHHLRHRHAIDWLQSGRSLYNLQQRLGHTSIKTTEVYLDYLAPEMKDVVRHGQGMTT